MKQSDKEFLCYLICLSWDRLDDQERIRASKIIREITDREDDVPKVEYVNPEIISRLTEVPTDASYEWHKDRVSLPDDLQHRLTELHKALGDVLTKEPNKTEPMIELHLTEDEWYYIRSQIKLVSPITGNPPMEMQVQDKLCLAFDEYYKRKKY